MAKKIRIRELIPGASPEYVREMLIGCAFPFKEKIPRSEGYLSTFTGILGGPFPEEHLDAHYIAVADYLAVLRAERPEAAEWYAPHLARRNIDYIFIGKRFCDVVEE